MPTPDPTVWDDLIGRAADWADRRDELGAEAPGTPATVWAATKAVLGLAAAPLTVPAVTAAAVRTTRRNGERIRDFPDHLHALAEGRTPPLPGDRTERAPASARYLITSDLHRCIAGRLDWPRRQGVKELYRDVLAGYALEGWHLIENGDVEDFWMVGGSDWGAVYDLAWLGGAAAGPAGTGLRRRTLCEHLDRIIENNADIYEVLRDGFGPDRYLRTMGNHDDVFDDPAVAEHLASHLPGAQVTDTILLTSNGAGPHDGIAGVEAVVAHGHLTDSWNGAGFALLGRSMTWLASGIEDLPGVRSIDALPDAGDLARLLNGRTRNRLIAVDPRLGGNRQFDSLDEVRLFERLDQTAPPGGWPWIVFGHTHFPMLRPLDPARRPVRYANSGCGVLHRAVTALEWDGSTPEDPLRLVVWQDTPSGPRRTELVPDGGTLRPV